MAEVWHLHTTPPPTPASATTLLRGLNDPTAQLFDAVWRYTDGLHVAAVQLVGPQIVGMLDRLVDQVGPLQAAGRQVGLPDIGLHTLRHSAAAVMLVNGVPLKVVSEVLGHASIGITGDIYGHVSPDVSREALARLSDALGDKRWS